LLGGGGGGSGGGSSDAFSGGGGIGWGASSGGGGFGNIGDSFGSSSSSIFGNSAEGGGAAAASTFGSVAGFGEVGGGGGSTATSPAGFGSSPTSGGFAAVESAAQGDSTWGAGASSIFAASDAPAPMFGLGGSAAQEKEDKVLGEAKAQDTGESNERHLFSMKAKLHQFVKKQGGGGEYKARGRGITLTLNVTKTEPKKYRLVARQDATKVLCLNAPVWPGLNPTLEPPKTLMVQCVDYSEDAKADTDVTKNTAPKTVQLFLVGGGQADIKELNELLKGVVTQLKEAAPVKEAAAAAGPPCYSPACRVAPGSSACYAVNCERTRQKVALPDLTQKPK